jgi:hypothetical protein
LAKIQKSSLIPVEVAKLLLGLSGSSLTLSLILGGKLVTDVVKQPVFLWNKSFLTVIFVIVIVIVNSVCVVLLFLNTVSFTDEICASVSHVLEF